MSRGANKHATYDRPLTEEQKSLVEKNLRMAKWFANRWMSLYPSDFAEFDDAAQVATEGLVRAAQRHDPAKGKFTTIAFYAMRAAMNHATINHRRRAKQTGHPSWSAYGRLVYSSVTPQCARAKYYAGDGECVGDNFAASEPMYDDSAAIEEIDLRDYADWAKRQFLASIRGKKTRAIVEHYFGCLNMRETAQRFGCTYQNVELLLRNARTHFNLLPHAA